MKARVCACRSERVSERKPLLTSLTLSLCSFLTLSPLFSHLAAILQDPDSSSFRLFVVPHLEKKRRRQKTPKVLFQLKQRRSKVASLLIPVAARDRCRGRPRRPRHRQRRGGGSSRGKRPFNLFAGALQHRGSPDEHFSFSPHATLLQR